MFLFVLLLLTSRQDRFMSIPRPLKSTSIHGILDPNGSPAKQLLFQATSSFTCFSATLSQFIALEFRELCTFGVAFSMLETRLDSAANNDLRQSLGESCPHDQHEGEVPDAPSAAKRCAIRSTRYSHRFDITMRWDLGVSSLRTV
jgi:hypothetical protein